MNAAFLEWVKAMGIPTLAVAVSFASYRSAHWQTRIARERLRHDLYDRRHAIYVAFRDLLFAVLERDHIEAELKQANTARAQGPFLLDLNLCIYLDGIYREACRIHGESKLLLRQHVWSGERASRAIQLGSDKKTLAERSSELIRQFDCLRLTDLSQ